MSQPNSPSDEGMVSLRPAQTHRHHGAGWRRRKSVIGLLAVITLVGAGAGVAALFGFLPVHMVGDPNPKDVNGHGPVARDAQSVVKVIRPRRDPSVRLAVEALATVEPYFRADLRARASGLVKSVPRDIGDRVRRGELLVEIDVPELFEEVAQKEAAVTQRQQEVRVSQAMLKDAEAKREVAKVLIRQRETEVAAAQATRDLKVGRYERYRKLAGRETIPEDVLKEQEGEARAGESALMAAKVAVEKASADLTDADARVETAAADIELKKTLVEVARRDLDRARAVSDYTRITAPFDGVVVRRTVDPGSFVQNATTGQSEPLVTIAQTDLVTVVAKVPEEAAALIRDDTDAVIELDKLPGVSLRAPVSRFSPSIVSADRTIRVEVDLFNGDDAEYHRIVDQVVSAELAGLMCTNPLSLAAQRLIEDAAMVGVRKGTADPFPVAVFTSKADTQRLIAGMYGTMRLMLRSYDAYVLPSSAVYTRAGKPYILVIEDGVAKQLPVRVQLSDGRVAKVEVLGNKRDATGANREVSAELTGREQVVAARQMEFTDGQRVTVVPSEW